MKTDKVFGMAAKMRRSGITPDAAGRIAWRLAAAALLLTIGMMVFGKAPASAMVERGHGATVTVVAAPYAPLWLLSKSNRDGSLEQKYEEWQSLSPEEKSVLRRRMDQLNQMPPRDRRHFERLFDRWQQLSPGERREIQRALDNWDSLSPREQEAVRKRFR
jgi:hypothetical protein